MPDTARISRIRSGRRTDIRQQNERLILEAAERVFAEAGFGGATMQLIADMAGLPKANLHYYYPTKEALYRRVVSQIFEIWLDAASSFDAAADPATGIGACFSVRHFCRSVWNSGGASRLCGSAPTRCTASPSSWLGGAPSSATSSARSPGGVPMMSEIA